METLGFGQPLGAVMQVAYIVEEMEPALEHWTKIVGVGPFFLFKSFKLLDAQYRGAPTDLDMDLALAFSGNMCFELIVQNNDVASVYSEVVAQRGYGFHHWAVSTRSFDADVARHHAAGLALAFSGVAGVGARAGYIDTTATLGGMIELIEINPKVEEFFGMLYDAAQGWDGTDPVRTLDA
jgi:hypothetical protein